MPKVNPKGPPPEPEPPMGDANDPDGFEALMERHLTWLEEHHYSAMTTNGRRPLLREFARWCLERGLARPAEVGRPVVEAYQRHLFHRRKAGGAPLSLNTQRQRLQVLRGFFSWLARHNFIPANPASELELPREDRRLPRTLAAEDVERILAGPDAGDAPGLRDRAMLEVLYSTGLRRLELGGLRLHDVDAARSILFIHQGKGRKDRVLPLGARALGWVRRYLDEARPRLLDGRPDDDGKLFLDNGGRAWGLRHLSGHVRRLVRAAGVERGGCHLFRHTMATLMLENGADVRLIQQMLGHSSLATTQIYTHVSIRHLQAVHALTHPAETPRQTRADEAGLVPPREAGKVDA